MNDDFEQTRRLVLAGQRLGFALAEREGRAPALAGLVVEIIVAGLGGSDPDDGDQSHHRG